MPANQLNLSAPDYLILIVEDLDRALGFYVDVLGLRLGHRSGDYAQLDTGTTRLALYTRSAMAKTLGMALNPPVFNAPGFEVGFKVSDVDAAFTELIARGAHPVMGDSGGCRPGTWGESRASDQPCLPATTGWARC